MQEFEPLHYYNGVSKKIALLCKCIHTYPVPGMSKPRFLSEKQKKICISCLYYATISSFAF